MHAFCDSLDDEAAAQDSSLSQLVGKWIRERDSKIDDYFTADQFKQDNPDAQVDTTLLEKLVAWGLGMRPAPTRLSLSLCTG